MIKTIGIILLVIILSIIFVEPLRNYLNKFFYKEKGESTEVQVIGTVSGYNPRVEEIQRILKGMDFDPGPVDGVMGSRTRRAIREFQKEKGLLPSGKVDSKTWLKLIREKEALSKEVTPQPSVLPYEEKQLDVKSKEEVRKIMAPQEQTIKEKTSKDRKKQIQIALHKSGFYKGKIDGKIGPQTKQAIKEFQKAKGLKVDGIVGKSTWNELKRYLE
ncbi:MAG: peptidoglycan-binding protein [Candidatus Omnitrophica bacterium]|nr:peptidoglycan-binding protein [Candidatus Omnitrophota bacterium]